MYWILVSNPSAYISISCICKDTLFLHSPVSSMWYHVFWELLTKGSGELCFRLQGLQYSRIPLICYNTEILITQHPSRIITTLNFCFLLEISFVNETGKSQVHPEIYLQKLLYFSCCCVSWPLVWYSNFLNYEVGIKSITQLMFLLDVYCGSKRLHVSAVSGHHQVFVIWCFLRVLYIIMWWHVWCGDLDIKAFFCGYNISRYCV